MENKNFLAKGTFFYSTFANCVHAQNDVYRKRSRLREIRFGDVVEIAVFGKNADIATSDKIADNAETGETAKTAKMAVIADRGC